jgi:DNA-binding SARP family transcriptional activator/Tfp pilus assembly protein PilF
MAYSGSYWHKLRAKPTEAVVEFGVLGPVEVWVDGRPTNAGHARQRAVLAVLLLDAGRAVPLEVLIDRVWDENPPRSVRNVVYGYVARLRALLASGQDPGVGLSRRTGGYLLDAGLDQVDLGRFRRLVTQARAAGDDDSSATTLGEALALWRGPALAGLDSPWLNAMRATLELERAGATADLNEIRLRRGEHGALAGELAALATAAPADERLIGQLMLALYRSGRQADALRWYEQTRRHLAGELGADPGLQLAALHQQILRADPRLATPPEAVRTAAPPRELPADVSAFTGRTTELRQLDELLAGGAAHGGRAGAAVISAVSGTAGVGKTALAVHWAHQAADRFPDGQLYVNLRGYDPARPMTAADALAGFLRTLGVPGPDIPPGEGERAARYRSLLAGRQMLVVLDNAGDAEQVRPLLPGTPGCGVVVTSRDSMPGLVARDGAARLDLDLLPLDEAVGLLRGLIGERAEADPHAAAALAEHCCRLPLALRVAAELAVARPAIPVSGLVAELTDQQRRLDLLDADGDPRTAVRTVFSWSYQHLEPGAARAFGLAGLHPGPDVDSYAAAALTGTTPGQARQTLDALARAHLVHPSRPGRYAMHDLLRAYASELARNAPDDDGQRHALTRLFDYYLHAAATAMDALMPSERHRRPRIHPSAAPVPPLASTAAAQSWLDDERATLVAVTAYAAERGWAGHATRLAAILYRYLYLGSHHPEAIVVHTHARNAARGSGDRAAEAAALTALGTIDRNQARYRQADDRHQQALVLFRETGDCVGEARALGNLGLTYANQGRFQEAASAYGQALEFFRETGDREAEVRTMCNLGIAEEGLGLYEQAERRQEQSVAVATQIGARDTEYLALLNLGTVRLRQGRYTRAADDLGRALDLCRETGYRTYEALALTRMGDVCLGLGRPRDATGHLSEALVLFQQLGDPSGEADVLNSLGEVLMGTGQIDDARARHTAALDLARPVDDKFQQARAYNGLGQASCAKGDTKRARGHWLEAFTIFAELGVPEASRVRSRLDDQAPTSSSAAE